MKYLCLICAETVMEMMPEADAAKHYREYAAFTEEIKRNGHFISANRLQPVETATTIRVRNGKVSVTDGPFAETKEQFGGYYVIEARDLNEAIQVAAKIPGARYGCVEIRPIAEDVQTRALGF
ncbi:MAG: YciI family protein [Candidatus Manganitrophaceae bacterium]